MRYAPVASALTGMFPSRNDHRLPKTWLQEVPWLQPVRPWPDMECMHRKILKTRTMAASVTIVLLSIKSLFSKPVRYWTFGFPGVAIVAVKASPALWFLVTGAPKVIPLPVR